jgi:hypothetical protein
MSLRIKLKTFKMTGEDQQLEEIINNAKVGNKGRAKNGHQIQKGPGEMHQVLFFF